jgi:hypothetical protein
MQRLQVVLRVVGVLLLAVVLGAVLYVLVLLAAAAAMG